MDLQLKIGNIVNTRGPIKNKEQPSSADLMNSFQCRLLPDMADIQEEELLPWYPNFFTGSYKPFFVGDAVWVLCSEDYQVGYILGMANSPAGEGILGIIAQVNGIEAEEGLEQSSYETLSIEVFSKSFFSFANRLTGVRGVVYSNNSYYIMSPSGEFYMHSAAFTGRVNSRGDLSLSGRSRTDQFKNIKEESTTSEEETVTKKLKVSGNLTEAVSGSRQLTVAGNQSRLMAGNDTTMVAKKKEETVGSGESKKVITGGYKLTVLQGNINLTTAVGGMSIQASGKVEISSGAPISLTSLSQVEVNAPTVKVPAGSVIPTGKGPFCALPTCLFTGAPHVGNISAG